jgi:hypothetical protein
MGDSAMSFQASRSDREEPNQRKMLRKVRNSSIFAYVLLFPNQIPEIKRLDLVSVQRRKFYIKFSFHLSRSQPETT